MLSMVYRQDQTEKSSNESDVHTELQMYSRKEFKSGLQAPESNPLKYLPTYNWNMGAIFCSLQESKLRPCSWQIPIA